MGTPAPLTADAELPRSVRRGPRITITCKCGEVNYLQYGEQWTCPKCKRHWNTRKIPIDEYAELRRAQLRMRRIPIAISVLSLICVVVFILLGKAFGGLILIGFLGSAWSMFVRPFHKRRYRERLAKLPSWDIEPD
jgi:hypothetical protein